ncbi:hypothetical protein QBC46DRAFT_160452 [Diplogelasinospora grovesii]|uniref:Uncharacterized protein n=1 Tax=Diplogelasinospora grovesii TaxID=303347 RepID=A0AAN6S3T5_9PEZI|nr:hypothetical protein QBC46DRAFT_160452 [Diplogelasinospora grovesii]
MALLGSLLEYDRLFQALEREHRSLSLQTLSDWDIAMRMFRFVQQREYHSLHGTINPTPEERHRIVRAYGMTRMPGNMMWIPGCDPKGYSKDQLVGLCWSLGRSFSNRTTDALPPVKTGVRNMIQYHFQMIIEDDRLADVHGIAMGYKRYLADESVRFLDLPLWDPHHDFPLLIGNGECDPDVQLPSFMKPPLMPFGVGFHRFLTLVGEFRDGDYERGAFFDAAKRGFWEGLHYGLQTVNPNLRDWVMDKNNAGLIQKAATIGVMLDAFVLVNNDARRYMPHIYRADILIKALHTVLLVDYLA